MREAYKKDIIRSIGRTKRRFLSILAITALGVTILTGIYAACQDMYQAADYFYDSQNLFDIRILSTLGLTEDDVRILQEIAEIETAEGMYSEAVNTFVKGVKQTAQMTVLGSKERNKPYVMEGRLPNKKGEIAVTQKYLDDAGKKIGDTLTIEEDSEPVSTKVPVEEVSHDKSFEEENETSIEWDTEIEIDEEEETPNFVTTAYTITAVVVDPMDISNNTAAFRSMSSATDYTFFIIEQDVESDIYSAIYLTLEGTKDYNCFSEEYEKEVARVIKRIEAEIKSQREAARFESIQSDALNKIEDAEDLMNEKFTDADKKFVEAWEDVAEAEEELKDGEETLTTEEKDAYTKIAEAKKELSDGEETLREEEAEAYRKISEAWTELSNGRIKLGNGEKELKKGKQELEEGIKDLEKSEKELAKGKKELDQGKKEAEKEFSQAEQTILEKQSVLEESLKELEAGRSQLQTMFGTNWPQKEWNVLEQAAAKKTLELLTENPDSTPEPSVIAEATIQEQSNLAVAIGMLGVDPVLIPDCIQSAIGIGIVDGGLQMLANTKNTLDKQKETTWKEFSEAEKEIKTGETEIAKGWRLIEKNRKKLGEGKKEIEDGWKELNNGEAQLKREEEKAKQELADAWKELEKGKEELKREEEKAKRELADARKEIEEGKQELLDGETELLDNQTKYFEKKEEAMQKVADAYEELKDLDVAQWYVQDRNSLDSYSSLKSDMSSIESVGRAFPVLFLIVAILISLTTMTRMIEEERGLIGTYRALGFSDGSIYIKYALYALLACICGSFAGDIGGFVLLPKFLIYVLQSLYILPNITLRFDMLYGSIGFLLFTGGIIGATLLACHSEMKQMPAVLMRPKAPRAGSRVFFERMPFIWNKLKFLNKVTIRNLFRYKKRFFMTVFGIMGCTALVLAGFAIKDSATDLMPKQYDYIYQYDLMVAVDSEDNDIFLGQMTEEGLVDDYVNLEMDSYKVINADGVSETVQIMIVPDSNSLETYIRLLNTKNEPVMLDDSGILITRNAAELLGVGAGDTVKLQNLHLERVETAISEVVQNYLGNNVYMTKELYETLFEEYSPNGILAHLSEECVDHQAYEKELGKDELVVSAVSIAGIKADFATNFAMLNSVTYVIIVLAAGLAFVVLFTLSNTNISERIRELATTKVLGFYDREVHAYVNKETLILTLIGILLGLPVGRFLSGLLTSALKMPAMYFAVHLEVVSYCFAVGLSFSFALIVNIITNRTLNRINMVEALKSVE